MDKNQDHIWSFPLVGGILTLIGLFTPGSIFGTTFTWMWGFSFFDGGPPFFSWSLIAFLIFLTPFIILIVSSIFAIILSILIRINGDFQRFQKLLFVNGGLFILGALTYFSISFSLIYPFWQFYVPGFALIAPFISGAILIFGTLFNSRVIYPRSQRSDLILKIKKFYRNILLSLSLGGALFLIGTIISFSLIYVLPGDPVNAYLSAMGIVSPTPAQYQAAQQTLGLDLNPILQYIKFLCQTITGNTGISVYIAASEPVSGLIAPRLTRMFEVMTLPLIIVIALGILLGRILARKRGQWYEKSIQFVYILFLAFPVFIIGMICQFLLSYGAGIIPATGYKTASLPNPTTVTGFLILDSLLEGNFALAIDIFYHLLTPMIIFGIVSFALITWQTRSYMVNKSHEGSILRPTIITGTLFGFIFMFYVLIDMTFNLSGFGYFLIQAIELIDYYVIIRSIFALVIIFVILIVISTLSFSIYNYIKSLRNKPKPQLTERDENTEINDEGNIKEYISHKMKKHGTFNTIFKIILGSLSFVLLTFFIIIAIFPQLITQYTLQQAATVQVGAWNPPSPTHPLGQTQLGFDVQGLVMYGIGDSMLFGTIAALVGLAGGLPIGILTGRFRKWIYEPTMGILLIFYIIPLFVIVFLVYRIFGFYYVLMMVLVGVLLIPVNVRAFSNAISGKLVPDLKRIGKKILGQLSLNIATAVMIYNVLGFIGAESPSFPHQLGYLIVQARAHLYDAPWATFWPGLAIFGIVITFLLLYLVFQDYGVTAGTFKLRLRSYEEPIEFISE
ncbi:MAG: ABC transporter permease subunit [Candidatus Hermodarchaeota archaeon]